MITIKDTTGTQSVILGTNGEDAIKRAIEVYIATHGPTTDTSLELAHIHRYISGDFRENTEV